VLKEMQNMFDLSCGAAASLLRIALDVFLLGIFISHLQRTLVDPCYARVRATSRVVYE